LKALVEAVPDLDGEVFGGGVAFVKGGYFVVQVAMVHGIDHLLHHDVLEILEVVDHAGNGIDLSGEGDFGRDCARGRWRWQRDRRGADSLPRTGGGCGRCGRRKFNAARDRTDIWMRNPLAIRSLF
jgi:hypothetical protein